MAKQRMVLLLVVQKKGTEDDPDRLRQNPRQYLIVDPDLRRPMTVTTVEDDVAVGNDAAVAMTVMMTATVILIGSVAVVEVDTVAVNDGTAIETTTTIIPGVVVGIIIITIASVVAVVAAAGRGVVTGGAAANVIGREVLPVTTVLVGTRINGGAIEL